jgi:hypothetical protein
MPMFRVELVRHVPLVDMPRNPFSAAIDVLKPIPCTTTARVWEFEAKSEREVRKLLDEAFKQNLPNVRGFHLGSITRLPKQVRKGHG